MAPTTEQKNAALSLRILLKMSEGMTPDQALDAVLGAGTFQRIAGEVYDQLRAEPQPTLE